VSEPSAAAAGTRAGPTPAIVLDALERRYGERTALHGVTVTVPAGATLAVFGSNGAGKTTLLRILAGLLRPHAGSASVLGNQLPRDAWKTRAQVGYVAHDTLLYRDLSVEENLRFHARLHKAPQARVAELIEAVGLKGRASDPVKELSKGMTQRAAVARALLHDPQVLLLDEPRANLDPAAADHLEPLIGRASKRTRVIVSHDVETTLAEADVALGLRAGAQVFAGRVDVKQVRSLYA
jgi:heme exporter protein A